MRRREFIKSSLVVSHMPPYVNCANAPDTCENCPLVLRETRLKACCQ